MESPLRHLGLFDEVPATTCAAPAGRFRTLMVLGNFNMTNTPELNQRMVKR